jgi:phosphate/sulfate permease
MFANVILLDLFNSLGMPTSTTVSLVFGLLGAAIAVATVRISQDPTLTLSSLSQFINSGKALAIVGGILASVAIAFVSGTIVMFISRLVFTFDYEKLFRRFGSLWCGIAFTVIIYFALFKGLKSSGVISADFYALVENNLGLSIFIDCLVTGICIIGWGACNRAQSYLSYRRCIDGNLTRLDKDLYCAITKTSNVILQYRLILLHFILEFIFAFLYFGCSHLYLSAEFVDTDKSDFLYLLTIIHAVIGNLAVYDTCTLCTCRDAGKCYNNS